MYQANENPFDMWEDKHASFCIHLSINSLRPLWKEWEGNLAKLNNYNRNTESSEKHVLQTHKNT